MFEIKGKRNTSICDGTLDEAPMAYKAMEDILPVIRESVNVIDIMKPVYNFKADSDELPWKKKDKENMQA